MYRNYLGRKPKRRRVAVTRFVSSTPSRHVAHPQSVLSSLSNSASSNNIHLSSQETTLSSPTSMCFDAEECTEFHVHDNASTKSVPYQILSSPHNSKTDTSTDSPNVLSPKTLDNFDSFPTLSTYINQSFTNRHHNEMNNTQISPNRPNCSKPDTSLLFKESRDKSLKSAYNRKLRLIKKLKLCIESLGTTEQQAVIVEETLNLPSLKSVKQMAHLVNEEDQKLMCNVTKNVFKSLKQVSEKPSSRGRLNNDKRVYQESLVSSIVSSPSMNSVQSNLTIQQMQKYMMEHSNFAKSTARRALHKGMARRAQLTRAESKTTWCILSNRPRYKTIQRSLHEKLLNWILSHENVIPSPQKRDTILVYNPSTKKREPVTKLLLQCSVRELHDDLIGPPPKGLKDVYQPRTNKLLISESTLRLLLPPQLRPMTMAQKEICGCECCITIKMLHQSLMHYKSVNRSLRSNHQLDIFLNGMESEQDSTTNFHSRPSDLVKLITCPPCMDNQYKWHCLLDRCNTCSSRNHNWYGLRHCKESDSNQGQNIHFGIYKLHTRCKVHGKLTAGSKECPLCALNITEKDALIISKKELTKMQSSVSIFLNDYYFPHLHKFKYHIALVQMLGKFQTKLWRKKAFEENPRCLLTEMDYAERMKKEMDNEIQSDHFGHHASLSIEGCTMEHHQLDASTNKYRIEMDFHSHMSDDSDQNAATTHVHMCKMLDCYIETYGSLPDNCIILDHTDGCAKQYRCGNALFYLTLLSQKYRITIDRAVAAPGHGKSIIDGLNAVDKTFLKRTMMISNQFSNNVNERHMNAFNFTNADENSFAEECARLCKAKHRQNGVLTGSNYGARVSQSKLTRRFYHVHNDKKHNHVRISKSTTGWLTSHGVKAGIMYHHNFRADPKLPIGKIAVRRIPCACKGCIDQLNLPWLPNQPFDKQPRYKGGNMNCMYWEVFNGLNDWLLIDILDTVTDDQRKEELQSIMDDSLLCNAMHVANLVKKNGYGAFATEDNSVKVGYYIVQWTSVPYYLHKDETLTTFDPPMHLKAGDVVCDAVYLNAVFFSKFVYTHSTSPDMRTKVLLKHVAEGDIEVKKISGKEDMPQGMKRHYTHICDKDTILITEDTHQNILDEIERRNNLDIA